MSITIVLSIQGKCEAKCAAFSNSAIYPDTALVCINDLFSDDELLPRLRRLFWLEATKTERDYNNYLVKPTLKQHDRNLQSETLREAMEVDLESVSDLEGLMRIWEGLHKLEVSVVN